VEIQIAAMDRKKVVPGSQENGMERCWLSGGHKMTRHTAASTVLVLAAAVSLFAPIARADGFTVTLLQVGPNVVASGSGAINLTGLSFSGTFSGSAAMKPSAGVLTLGPTALVSVDDYTPISGPSSFGPGGATSASSGSGDEVAVDGGNGALFVPQGYTSESPLTDTTTWNGTTLSSLGVTPGTYTWTWGTGKDQDFTLVVPSPEPSSLMLLGTSALGLILMRRKMRV
jgi:hypothetical protein